jgi:FkbM family methyltransferase
MWKIELSEFVPPIIPRAYLHIRKKVGLGQSNKHRLGPFGSLPKDLEAKWILDIGANVGDVAEAALISYRDCNVICFEPVKDTYSLLKMRLSKYSDRVELHRIALSSYTGEGEINLTTFSGANSISEQAIFHKECNPHVQEIGKEKIKFVQLDDFREKLPNVRFDIIKIDVEGHELEVLKGGFQFICTKVDFVIIEISLMRDHFLHDQSVFEIFALMKKAGFVLHNAIDFHRTIDGTGRLTQFDCIFRKLDCKEC